MPIIAQLMTMKAQTRCLQLETYLWLYFGILGLYESESKFFEDRITYYRKTGKKYNQGWYNLDTGEEVYSYLKRNGFDRLPGCCHYGHYGANSSYGIRITITKQYTENNLSVTLKADYSCDYGDGISGSEIITNTYSLELPLITFQNNSFSKFVLPSNITSIGGIDCRFRVKECDEYVLGSQLNTIGENAFMGSHIGLLTFNSTINEIKGGAFENATGDNFTNPQFVERANYIGEGAFRNSNLFGNVEGELTLQANKIDQCAFQNAVMPKTVSLLNVEEMGESVFSNTSIEKIVIGDKLKDISNGTFANCSDLHTFNGGSQICSIGDMAFWGCKKLITFNLSTKLISIGKEAFCNTALVKFTVPNTTKTIGYKAFANSTLKELNLGMFANYRQDIIYGCDSLEMFSVSDNNDNLKTESGVLFSKNGSKIISYPCAKKDAIYELGNSVTQISDSAFYAVKKLRSLVIPESVEKIGKNAFANSGICEIKLLPSTTPKVTDNISGLDQSLARLFVHEKDYSTYYIANYWGDFKNIYVLEKAVAADNIINVEKAGTLPEYIGFGNLFQYNTLRISGYLNSDDVRYLREMAGRNIHGEETNGVLSDLDISKASIVAGGGVYYRMSDITSGYKTSDNIIGEKMFKGCHLTNFAISETATKMEKDALTGCMLTTFNVPASLQEIDLSSFFEMNTLEEITVDNNNNNYQVIDNVLFSKNGNNLLLYPYAKKGNIYVVPENVTCINERAFGGSNLQEVYTNEGLTKIDHWAFENLYSLEKITLPSTLREIGVRAFWGCNKLMMISCKATYPPTLRYNSYSYSGQPYNNFSDNTYEKATLFVPKNSSSYKSQAGWKLFKNIIEVDNWSNGIKTINNSNEVIKRYDINGRDVKSSYRGISIIKMSDGTTKKVIMK